MMCTSSQPLYLLSALFLVATFQLGTAQQLNQNVLQRIREEVYIKPNDLMVKNQEGGKLLGRKLSSSKPFKHSPSKSTTQSSKSNKKKNAGCQCNVLSHRESKRIREKPLVIIELELDLIGDDITKCLSKGDIKRLENSFGSVVLPVLDNRCGSTDYEEFTVEVTDQSIPCEHKKKNSYKKENSHSHSDSRHLQRNNRNRRNRAKITISGSDDRPPTKDHKQNLSDSFSSGSDRRLFKGRKLGKSSEKSGKSRESGKQKKKNSYEPVDCSLEDALITDLQSSGSNYFDDVMAIEVASIEVSYKH